MAAGDASVEKILADNTYRYNKNGQQTEKTTLAGTTKYMYDVLGQLIQENNHIYTYDRAGNRTSVQTDDRREIYSYDRGRLRNRTVERQQDPAGSQTYTYRYDAQENTLSDGENTYLYDCLNRITEVKTKAGDIQKNHYAYDAFGNRTVEEETVENRFGFAGEMLDAVTGQYYLRARFYNPVIARFLSEDTYYGDGLNLYSYCHNNPVGYVDPSGHICEKKYQELKSKEPSKLTEQERADIKAYEHEKGVVVSAKFEHILLMGKHIHT